MIGYLYIVLALFCFTAQFAFNKIYEKSMTQNMFTMFVFIFITNAVGSFLMLCINSFNIEFTTFSFLMAVGLAVVTIIVDILSILILSLGNLAMYSAFMMIGGMVLPFICGMCFLSDPFTVWKIIGIVLLTFFLILQVMGQKGDVKNKFKYYLLCIIIFIVNGSMGVFCSVHDSNSAQAVSAKGYILLQCLICTGISIIVLPILYFVKRKINKGYLLNSLKPAPVLSSVAMGIVMNMGNLLLLWALASGVAPSSQYPIVSGGCIVLSALCSLLIFREKMKKLEIISVVLIFLTTFLFLL